MSVGVVQRHHVRSWADQADSRYGLPELVLRLVLETSEGVVEAEFATDEGVDLDGFDGIVQAEVGSRRVPSGCSVWEVSTERSVGTKASADYDQRDAAPPGWAMAETAYVAVSLRAWREQEKWAEQRTGRWRKVRALGLDRVMSWLANAPKTELWLADRLGLHPEELELGSKWWKERQRGTGGLFDRRVALAGRHDAAAELRQRVADDAGSIVVEAAAVDEALEFIAAAGEPSDELGNDENLLDRMVFVSGRHGLQRLLTEEGPEMVLVVTDPELGSVVGPSRHTVVLPVQAHGGAVAARRARDGTRDCVVVPHLDSRSVAGALDSAEARDRGIGFRRAQELGSLAARSASALRRELSVDPTIRLPGWAQADADSSVTARRAKTAALLAGQWTAGSSLESAATSADREVLARLAGGDLDYETVELELRVLTGPDPMLAWSGSGWRLVNPNEAWLLLAGHLLTADAIHRFILVAAEVLGERDPLRDLTGDERFEALLQGGGRRHSKTLRLGAARTLALLCIHGSNVALPNNQEAADLARHCIQQLFEPDDDGTAVAARVRRLAELGEVLPLLAEAVPDEFMAAVNQTLQPLPEAARAWFTDAWDGLGGAAMSSPHIDLLFALEPLAWLPDCLPYVADILLRLQMLDPGGNLANRPAAMFAAIFYWAPQTGIDHRDRLEVLRGLHGRLRGSGADGDSVRALGQLLAALMPRGASLIMSSSPPRIREYELPPDRVTSEVVSNYFDEVVELLLSLTEHRVRERGDAAALLDLLEPSAAVTTATSLPPGARDRLWALFEEAVSIFEADELSSVGQRLQGLVRSHKSYPDADWALLPAETNRLDRLAHQIAGDQAVPADPIEENLWLFAEYHPGLGHGIARRDDKAAYEQTLRTRRAAAVGEVARAEGLSGLYRLAACAEADGRGAPAAVIGAAIEELESGPNADSDQPLLAGGSETRMLEALDLPADDAANSPEQGRQVAIASGYFLARLHRTRRAGSDGWVLLSGLLHREGVTASQQARLIELTDDGPRAWQEAEALGPGALTAYWRLMQWYRLDNADDHLQEITQGLLSVGRSFHAVDLLASNNEASALEPRRRAELAADALEALAESGEAQSVSASAAWDITQLLDSIAQHLPLTQYNLNDPLLKKLTRLDMIYAALRRLGEPAPFIHRRMSLDPSSFVEVVRLAHTRTNEQPQDLNPLTEMTPDPSVRPLISRMTAYHILTSWQHPPGTDNPEALDYDRMTAWIAEAQRRLDVENCREVGDRRIGEVLSAAPADPSDGIAPPVPIRQLLQDGQTPELERGLKSGLLMGPTGVKSGGVVELAAEAQQAHQQLERNAAKIAAHWPRAAQLLREVARAHGRQARGLQDDLDLID